MQYDFAAVRGGAVLGEEQPLPGAQRQRPLDDGYGDAGAGEHLLEMRRHIVRPLAVVIVAAAPGRDAAEPGDQVRAHGGRGVLSDEHAGRGVPAERGEQPGGDAGGGDEGARVGRELVQRGAVGGDREGAGVMGHGAR